MAVRLVLPSADAPPSGLEVLRSTDDTLCLAFGSVVPALVTALRRAVMGDVPGLAFVRVVVHVNQSQENSQLVEESMRQLALRPHPAARMQHPLTCSACQSTCQQCALVFRVDVEHPADAPEPLRWVTGRDVRPPAHVPDAGLAPAALSARLVPLLRGERFAADLVAQRGYGRDAAEFAVTTVVSARPRVVVSVDAERARASLRPDQVAALAALCPKRVFDPATLEPVRADRCDACMECCPREGFGDASVADVEDGGVPFVRVTHATDPRAPEHRRPMLLTVETTGGASGKEALLAACASLRARVLRISAGFAANQPAADAMDTDDGNGARSTWVRARALAVAGPGPWALL